jgi:hypothetical protein
MVLPFQMSGAQGIYKLDKKVASAALRGLRPAPGPNPIKFSDQVAGVSAIQESMPEKGGGQKGKKARQQCKVMGAS